jgi:hypothetical protein
MPDYIVIRSAADAPADFLSAALDGRWLDTRNNSPEDRLRSLGLLSNKSVPTDRTEERGDGAVAQVWEIGPPEL